MWIIIPIELQTALFCHPRRVPCCASTPGERCNSPPAKLSQAELEQLEQLQLLEPCGGTLTLEQSLLLTELQQRQAQALLREDRAEERQQHLREGSQRLRSNI